MKIKKLTIKNFKAFYGEYSFDFDSKNVLIYGENGSGKSSLYWALYHIFNSFNKEKIIKKYKNIFADKEESFLKLEFDNEEKVEYKEKSFSISNEIKELFEKFKKVKLFLSYNDIFLLNELFDKNISIEKFVSILKSIYTKDIIEQLDDYIQVKKDFKKNYLDKKCNIEKQLLEFREENREGELLDSFVNFDNQYDDIEKWDNEGDMIGYETVYYYPEELINEYESFLDNLKLLQNELELDSEILENIIFELEDIKEHIYEKTEESHKNKFYRDIEPIETIDILEELKEKLNFIIDIVESYQNYKEVVNNLNKTIFLKLEEQIKDINNILEKDFKSNLTIDLRQNEFSSDNHYNIDNFFPIKYKIEINDISPKHNHLKFLNEAKISSINFSFYLSIILSYATIDELKIIVLDDLLISLDMSNRDIILEIILEYFKDYQIIILTHDKAFFEMAKQKFNYRQKDKWKYFEMYVDSSGKFEKPLVLQHKTYFQKAKYYLAKCDYSACANYLRKESERLLKELVCNGLTCEDISSLQEMINIAKLKGNIKNEKQIIERVKRLTENEDFRNFDKTKLSNNIDKRIIGEIQTEFKKIKQLFGNEIEDLNNILVMLEQFKSIILNPQSHDDVTKPLYKKELEDAIKLIEEFKNLLE